MDIVAEWCMSRSSRSNFCRFQLRRHIKLRSSQAALPGRYAMSNLMKRVKLEDKAQFLVCEASLGGLNFIREILGKHFDQNLELVGQIWI